MAELPLPAWLGLSPPLGVGISAGFKEANPMKRLLSLLALATFVFLGASSARAVTVTFTGNESDFPGATLLEDDGVDTQLFDCGFGPNDGALDIGTVYCTNDATTLYIGLRYQRYCFCDMQLGIAIETNGSGGGTYDPFNRQISYPNPIFKPDFVVYDVVPTNCNGFNYEVIYKWDGASWVSQGDGSNFWNFYDADGFGAGFGFKEFAIPLSVLGVSPGQQICLEMWTTQDDFGSGLKPAFDMVVNDAYPTSQHSQFGGPTDFDVPDGQESQMNSMFCKVLEGGPNATEPTTWGKVKTLYQ
jgi:hypothetical protein